MNSSRDKILFWCLIAAEAGGSQAILWNGIPIYRRLLSPGTEGAGSKDFVLVTIVVIVMQVAHWAAFRLRPQLRFRRNVFLGHMLVFVGELSLFLSMPWPWSSVDRGAELDFVLWKILLLVAILFAICTYKYQLGKLGDSIIEGQPDAAAKQTSNASS
jgi:hypothetical protein